MKHLERMGNRMLWTAIIMTLVCGVYAVWNTAKAQSGIIQDGKITGQSFLTRCDSVFDRPPGELNKLETHFAGICYGVLYGLNGSAAHMPAWIAGRHTKIRKLTAEDIEPYRAYCAPNEMTLGQAKDILSKYLRENPKWQHLDIAGIWFLVMQETWPCD